MQKELKIFDQELLSHGLSRVSDISHKSDNSLYRALGKSILDDFQEGRTIISFIKLAVLSLSAEKNNPFPVLPRGSRVFKKYSKNESLMWEYLSNIDLNCFHQDSLEIVSYAFNLNITIFYLDHEQYLHEKTVTTLHTPKRQAILGKVGKKYYTISSINTQNLANQIKDTILQDIVNMVFEKNQNQDKSCEIRKSEQKENKVVFPVFADEDLNSPKIRKHRKSLSDCGELAIFLKAENEKQYEESSQRGYNIQHSPSKSHQAREEEFFDPTYQNYIDPNHTHFTPKLNHHASQPYYYGQYYQQPYPNYSRMNFQEPINGERYTGRLKFFDQSGNYGFIVIDSLNIDLFVHYDDLSKAGLNKDKLVGIKNNCQMRFAFTYYQYEGKQHKKSKKAVELEMLTEQQSIEAFLASQRHQKLNFSHNYS